MKCKKWLLPVLLVLMIFAVSEANAQFRFGVKGGYNLATVKFNKDALKSDNVDGFHVGPIFEFMFDGPIGVDFGLLYTRKGFFSEDKDSGITNDFLEVPVNLKIKLGLPVLSPYVAAGPYASFIVGGEKSIKNIVSGFENQLKAKTFGAGLNFTAGVEVMSRVQVGLTYNMGITDNYQEYNGSLTGKTHTWLFSATLLF